jgi:hypothetical protein
LEEKSLEIKYEKRNKKFRKRTVSGTLLFVRVKRDQTPNLLNAMAPHAKIEWMYVHKIDAKDTKY